MQIRARLKTSLTRFLGVRFKMAEMSEMAEATEALEACELDGLSEMSDAAAPPQEPQAQSLTLSATLAYNGAPFCGFARQPGLLTVQGELESALSL
jgi:hypothetical protein